MELPMPTVEISERGMADLSFISGLFMRLAARKSAKRTRR